MTYDQIKPLVDRCNADNLLPWCVLHASRDTLHKELERLVRVANDQTDTPQYIPVRDLQPYHVILY
jgi:hypothetical protein